jgi:paraquat-inducible protein A
MPTVSPLIVCEHCDALYRRRPLARGETARCRRCDAVLYRHQRLGVDAMLALSLAALVVMLIANVSPIVYVETGGVTDATTLWGAIVSSWHEHIGVVAVLAALTLFFFPLLQLLLLAWVFAFLRAGRRPPGFVAAMLALRRLHPWGMIEVLLLGLLVAVVKLSTVFEVAPGIGLWAFAVLTVLVTLVASFDTRELWGRVSARGERA